MYLQYLPHGMPTMYPYFINIVENELFIIKNNTKTNDD